MSIVYGHGPPNAPIFVCGEKPGWQENRAGRPFVGDSGQELRAFLRMAGINPETEVYYTNLDKDYEHGDPDPTPEGIAKWSSYLAQELAHIKPKLIVAVGRYASRWFLGTSHFKKKPQEAINGVVHRPGEFGDCDFSALLVPSNVPVIPTLHPSAGLRQERLRPQVWHAFQEVGKAWKTIKANQAYLGVDWEEKDFPVDSLQGKENYSDISPAEMASILDNLPDCSLGYDTEGTVTEPLCLQICIATGLAYMVRVSHGDFHVIVDSINRNMGRFRWHAHNWPYDVQTSWTMGIDFTNASLFDNMLAAKLLNFYGLSQSALAWQLCHMYMQEYKDVIGDVAKDAQLRYLHQIANDISLQDRFDKLRYRSNSGRVVSYSPEPMSTRAHRLIKDIEKGKTTKDGPVDPFKRWHNLPSERYQKYLLLRDLTQCERKYGKMPRGTLLDVDPNLMTWYSCRDADAALRIGIKLVPAIEAHGAQKAMDVANRNVCAVAEIERTGLWASRHYFLNFREELQRKIWATDDEIATHLPPAKQSKKWLYKTTRGLENRFPKASNFIVTYGNSETMPLDDTEDKVYRYLEVLSYDSEMIVPVEVIEHWTETESYFNSDAPACVRELIKHCNLEDKCTEKTDSGEISTSKDAIEHLRYLDPLMEQRAENSERLHVLTSFVDPILYGFKDDEDFRLVSGSVFMPGTETMRYTMHKTDDGKGIPMQTIPKRTAIGRKVRRGFECPPGWKKIACDFDQLEVRVLAHLSNDQGMIQTLNDPSADPHRELAALLFGIRPEDVTSEQRTVAKKIQFLMQYGGGASRLHDELRQDNINWTMTECEKAHAAYFKVRPGVTSWKAREITEARTQLYVVDCKGQRRYLPQLITGNRKDRSEAERFVISMDVQGMARYMLMSASAWLYPRLVKFRHETGAQAHFGLDLHDEVICVFKDDPGVQDFLHKLLIEAFTSHHGVNNPKVPFPAGCKEGTSWAEMEDI